MAFRSWKWLLLLDRQDTFAKAWRSRRGGGPSLRWKRCSHWSTSKSLDPEVRAFLEENTEVTSSGHLTPEIRLRLLTPRCRFWKEKPDLWPYGDPFWAIYWPGGQALSRYILDNPRVVKGRSVLDLGSGCGATAIAAVMSGASQVLANDIDPIAGMAMILNCELNHLNPFPITIKNIINSEAGNWDLIVLGDMFYDEQLADGLHHWLRKCIRIQQTEVLIGDPGRHQFLSHRIRSQLHKVIEYSLPEYTRQENNGLTSSIVWSYQPSGDAEQEAQESFSAPSVKEEPSAGLKHRPEVVTAAFLQMNQHFREVLQELSPLAANYWTSCDEELVTAELNTVHLQLSKY